MPPRLPTQEADDALFDDEPWVEPPIQMDYGTNVKVASNVFMNVNCVFLDTCITSIGSRTLVGPNVSFFSGTHPLDPELRDGTAGPETGKEIHVEEDCWIGGNAMILPGVRVGRGASIGAGSVVTKDVAPFTCVAGNPARLLRKIKTNMDPSQSLNGSKDNAPLEKPMAELATKLEEKEL
ncbi:hypothetical protein MMC14_002516 [Varicellaria rhodocarpa]|nr:hypothetical protein [Varicellaria rhodocarpa]